MRLRCAVSALAFVLLGCGDNNHIGGGHLLISPSTGLRTNETGASAMFTVALTREPTTDTQVAISSFDLAEGTVSPSMLTFTPADYDVPQEVIVKGVDDDRADGNRAFTVRVDGGHLGIVDLSISNDDDDMAGFLVSPIVGLETSEGGQQASFTVRLLSQPSSGVTIPLHSSDPTEGVTDQTSLVFTQDAWNVDQVVTVTGISDSSSDGNTPYSIVLAPAMSNDPVYQGLDPDDVLLMNLDASVNGVTVTPTGGLVTSEAGTTATISVSLQMQPTADVTFSVVSTNTSEAMVSTAQLVFTPQNWNVVQAITVTGANDFVVDGAQPFMVQLGAATSTDPVFSGIDPPDVSGTNTDDDTIGVNVTSGATPLQTSESGGTASFTVTLNSQPTANVSIGISTTDSTEGTALPTPLVFTPTDWNQPHTVTVAGVDDTIPDGDQSYTVVLAATTSADPLYNGVNAPDLAAVNHDNDMAGITVTPLAVTVSEFGDSAFFSIVLTSPPTANVTIGLTSSDTTEATVSPSSVTFTPQNWNVPQQVIVTGVNDNIADGNINFTIVTAPAVSGDAAYNLLDAADVSGVNQDNDGATVEVKSQPVLRVSENGTTATFGVRLTVAPTASVTCTLQSSDTTEGTVAPTSLTFTPANFGTYQTVTVTGVDDPDVDGDIPFTIIMFPCTSSDPAYNGSNPRDVPALNRDND
jgi:hypothetical protein